LEEEAAGRSSRDYGGVKYANGLLGYGERNDPFVLGISRNDRRYMLFVNLIKAVVGTDLRRSEPLRKKF
jgi:hypothetical protein